MHANAFGGSELLDTGMLKSSNFEDLAAWIEHIAALYYPKSMSSPIGGGYLQP